MAHQEIEYFRLTDDVHFPKRWYLGDVRNADNWALVAGNFADPRQPLAVEVYREGDEMDFTLTEAYGVPIVSGKLRKALGDLPGVRFLPIEVEGKTLQQSYFAMLIESIVDCVDESRSEFEKFEVGDRVRPDKAGQYRAFFRLVVDKARAMTAGRPVFRLARFEVAIIVSGDVRRIINSVGTRGAVMSEV
jgi:hypothetical protein